MGRPNFPERTLIYSWRPRRITASTTRYCLAPSWVSWPREPLLPSHTNDFHRRKSSSRSSYRLWFSSPHFWWYVRACSSSVLAHTYVRLPADMHVHVNQTLSFESDACYKGRPMSALVLPLVWDINEKVKFTNYGAVCYRNIYSQPACISGGEFKSIMALAASMSGSGKINQ